MSVSPDDPGRGYRNSLVTLLLIAAIGGLLWLVLGWDGSLTRSPAAPRAETTASVPAFVGASAKRVFLTQKEREEAARRGLLPANARSIIATQGKMDFGEWRWDDAGVPAGRVTVRVDLARQLVSVFQGADEVGTAVIVYGIDGKDSPRGRLPILGKTRDYHSITYDAPMPYSLWLREDGVALHGSSVSMGKATNGCIGVPVEFAGKLFEIADKGDIVEVVG